MDAEVEFLIEPFTEGHLGDHVQAGLDAVAAHGLDVDVGPFGTTTSGPVDAVAAAMADMVRKAMDAGAHRVSVTYTNQDASAGRQTAPGLHGALDRISAAVELELGAPLALSRHDKQVAVRRLNESGAFLLRKSIEDVAEHMGVSRITIYNYLNAIGE